MITILQNYNTTYKQGVNMVFFNAQKMLRGESPSGEIPSDKDILKRTLIIAWPSIVESFLVALVGFIDTIMVSGLGDAAIAAVGLTTQPKFIGLAFFISLNVAISAIIAHRKGEGDRESANRVLMQALMITVGMTIIVSVACVLLADPIITLAGANADTQQDAADYFRIIMGGMIFNVVSLCINAAQRGCGNTKIAMWTNIVSNLVNVVFNYLLIGGNFGFPALGVKGAAVASVIGTVVAMGMSIFSVMHPDGYLSFRHITKNEIRFDKRSIRSIINIGSSTLAEQIFLRIGFLTFTIVVANLGTTAFAAHQVGMNIMSLSFSFGDGLSAASIALVGQSLGAKRVDMARIYGGFSQRLGLIFAAFLSIIFLTLGRPIFNLFSDGEEFLDYGVMIMTVLTVVVFLQISQVIFSGCLRGAGDAKFTAFVSLVSVMLIRPGAGWLFCYPLGLGLFGAWIGLTFDQFCRFILTYIRFKSGRWTKYQV